MTDSGSLLDVYMAMRGQIAQVVMRIVPPKEVEDIVQETYVRLCRIKNIETIREPRSYMLRTARNLALDHMKSAEVRLADSADTDDLFESMFANQSEDPTYNEMASAEEFGIFCEAVRSLPKQSRRAFVLKKVYGYTLKEIMAEMSLGQATVETHIVNATKKCVKYMRELNDEELSNSSSGKPTSRSSKSRGDDL